MTTWVIIIDDRTNTPYVLDHLFDRNEAEDFATQWRLLRPDVDIIVTERK